MYVRIYIYKYFFFHNPLRYAPWTYENKRSMKLIILQASQRFTFRSS